MKTAGSLTRGVEGAFVAATFALGMSGSVAIAEPKGTLSYATQIQNTNWNPLVKSGETHTGIPV